MKHDTPLEVRLLWIATLAAMAASWTHLVSWIASWEYEGASAWLIAGIGATAVDLGILASMRSLDVLASREEDASGPRRTVYMLACVSFAANVLHALDARATRIGPVHADAGWIEPASRVAGAVLVAGVLPLIVVRLSHLLDRMTRLDAAATATRKLPATRPTTHPRSSRWQGWLMPWRRPATQAATQEPATQASLAANDAPASSSEPPAADAPYGQGMTQVAVVTATQEDDAGGRVAGTSEEIASAVRDAARSSPRASRRELARLAKVGDATVRRLERAGVLTWTDEGWCPAATNGHTPAA